jgi:hypothetical protein
MGDMGFLYLHKVVRILAQLLKKVLEKDYLFSLRKYPGFVPVPLNRDCYPSFKAFPHLSLSKRTSLICIHYLSMTC